MQDIYLEQLYSWGDPNRDPRDRIISTSYMGLVDSEKFHIKSGGSTQDADWFSITLNTIKEKMTENKHGYKKEEDIEILLESKTETIKNKVKVVKELKDGNEIIIITARDSEFHDDPYKYSKEWLDKNNIYYDKLVVNKRDKKKACIEENIDLFIDDSESNCLTVESAGIKAIRISNKRSNNDLATFKTWKDIYHYIQCNYNK